MRVNPLLGVLLVIPTAGVAQQPIDPSVALSGGRAAAGSYQQREIQEAEARVLSEQAEAIRLRNKAESDRQDCVRKARTAIEAGDVEKGRALVEACRLL